MDRAQNNTTCYTQQFGTPTWLKLHPRKISARHMHPRYQSRATPRIKVPCAMEKTSASRQKSRHSSIHLFWRIYPARRSVLQRRFARSLPQDLHVLAGQEEKNPTPSSISSWRSSDFSRSRNASMENVRRSLCLVILNPAVPDECFVPRNVLRHIGGKSYSGTWKRPSPRKPTTIPRARKHLLP